MKTRSVWRICLPVLACTAAIALTVVTVSELNAAAPGTLAAKLTVPDPVPLPVHCSTVWPEDTTPVRPETAPAVPVPEAAVVSYGLDHVALPGLRPQIIDIRDSRVDLMGRGILDALAPDAREFYVLHLAVWQHRPDRLFWVWAPHVPCEYVGLIE